VLYSANSLPFNSVLIHRWNPSKIRKVPRPETKALRMMQQWNNNYLFMLYILRMIMFISIRWNIKYFYLLLFIITNYPSVSMYVTVCLTSSKPCAVVELQLSYPVFIIWTKFWLYVQCYQKISEKKILTEVFLNFFLINFIHLLRLPPLRFHCGVGCWDWIQDCCDIGIGSQTF
jgi:hypothetical protein